MTTTPTSSSSPQSSVSLPLASRGTTSPVLPTPSNLTLVRTSSTDTPTTSSSPLALTRTKLVALEHQLAEKEKQLQESSGGIEKNVLVRQIRQLQEKIQQLDAKNQHQQQQQQQQQQLQQSSPATVGSSSSTGSHHHGSTATSHPDISSSTSSLTSTGTSNSEQDQLAPETMERLRYLERDLNTYRTSLVPGVSRKEKLLSQRSNALNPLPSPSSSSMQESSSASLLPLPPPLAGSTPTKRRSKVPNNDRRNTDIEFATEIGQGLLLEVRKMQTLLQEKEEQLRSLQIQKADLERAAEALTKQLRQKEETEERLKEETWNLELAKQELTMSVTQLQQNLNKANVEQSKLNRQLTTITSELEQVRGREDKLTATIENLKNRHEQDMAGVRRHMATMQREKADQAKQLQVLSSELAIAKAQSRIAKRSHQDLNDINNSINSSNKNTDSTGEYSGTSDGGGNDPTGTSLQQLSNSKLVSMSPSLSASTTLGGGGRQQQQAIEVETLKTSLGHAHRMVSTLRSNLHKEKTEKFELKKLLADSQETIEQLQNDPRMWEDAGQVPSSDANAQHTAAGGDASALDTNNNRKPRRSRRRSHARMMSTNSRSNSTLLKGDSQQDAVGDEGGRQQQQQQQPRPSRSRSSRVAFDDDNYSYSSFTSDDDDIGDEEDENDDDVDNVQPQQHNQSPGFTSLSMELSKSQQDHNNNMTLPKSNSNGLTSLSQELAKHLHPQPQPSTSTSSSISDQPKVHRSLGDELTFADAFRKASKKKDDDDKKHHLLSSGGQVDDDDDASNSDAFQDLLKGAAFGAAGTGLVGAIAQARAHRGVDSLIQTDHVVVSLPVVSKDSSMQTNIGGKDSEIQTNDDVVVLRRVEQAESEVQTESIVGKEMEVQTTVVASIDKQVQSMPGPESLDTSTQTHHSPPPVGVDQHIQAVVAVVELCHQHTQYVAPTPPVDQSTQSVVAEVADVGTQSEQVAGLDAGVQSVQVVMADVAVQSEQVDTSDAGVQSEQVDVSDVGVQSDQVDVADVGVQSDQVDTSDAGVQSEQVEASDVGIQSDQADVTDVGVQSDQVDVTDVGVQSDQASSSDMGVQSDLVSGADVGVQSDTILAAPVEEKGVQTDSGDETHALIAPMVGARGELSEIKAIDDENTVETLANGSSQDRDVKDSNSDNNAGTSTTMAALLASGAAALGLGAFARGNDSNDDSKPVLDHHDRSIQKNEESPSSLSTDDKDDLDIGHSKSTDTNAADDTKHELNKSTSENVDDDINHDMSKGSEDNTTPVENDKQQQGEERTITRSEADDMIAAAVASALKKHQDEQASSPSQAVGQQHLDANVSPLSALKASSIAKSLELTNDKRHTCDMSANEHHVTGGDDTRLSSDSKRSLSTEATTTTGSLSGTTSNNTTMEDHHSLAPGRPSSPPPPALLARSSMVLQQQNRGNSDRAIYPENSKGKWPMNQAAPSTPTPRQSDQSDSGVETEDSRHHHATSPTHMARVNPNYYTKGNDHGSNDSYYNNNNSATGATAGAAASTLSFASSQQQPQQTAYPNSSATTTATTSAGSPLAEPTIALITDTMMGHWLRKSPRNSGLLRNPLAQPHQRYVWMHPYTRTLYWSTHAPGTPNRDGKTKSAFIESMKVVPNPDEHLGSPQVSIQVSTSEGDMNLTAPDMNTHNTWAESLSYILSTSPESTDTRRMMKPRPTLGDEDSSREKTRTSLLQDLFNHTNGSSSTTASKPSNNRHSMHNWPTSSERRHQNDIVEENDRDEDDHVEQLEDLRMCCNGKHHLSHLERDRIHPNRPKYPKRSFRHSVAVGY
ncbi:unnamed protein product [Absidia cylindrospora]